jgi:hypothetical protein
MKGFSPMPTDRAQTISEAKENIRIAEATLEYTLQCASQEFFEKELAKQHAIIAIAEDRIKWLTDHYTNGDKHIRRAKARLHERKQQSLQLMNKKELQQLAKLQKEIQRNENNLAGIGET